MNNIKMLSAAVLIAALSGGPVQATGLEPAKAQPQIAETISENNQADIRNITAIRNVQTSLPATAANVEPRNVQQSGAQALMALGIALIVTPAMFGGAFSN